MSETMCLKFQRYDDLYSKYRRELPSKSVDDFYKQFMQNVEPSNRAFACVMSAMEKNWINQGRVYYKVWPEYVYALAKNTKFNVPIDLVRPPHPVFAIYLPKNCDIIQSHDQRDASTISVQSMLVACPDAYIDTNGNTLSNSPWSIICRSGDTDNTDYAVINHIEMAGHKTVEDVIQAMQTQTSKSCGLLASLECHRLALGVILLSISAHRCVEHDVLERLRERYDIASESEKQHLFEKSKRNHVHGYRIGRNLSLQTKHNSYYADSIEGRHLQWSHLRGCHFHTVACGPNKSERRVRWYDTIVVREDLPMRPVSGI